MADIVNLRAYRTKALEQRAFEPWHKRFGELYNQKTRLADLSDRSLYFLALPGEKNAIAFYEIIMGILDLGTAIKFYYLEKKEQLIVMDIHLFLADQVRFEMVRRLGWIISFHCERYGLLEMVLTYDNIKAPCSNSPPELAESHPDFSAYSRLAGIDKEVFIRRMLPQALKTFKEKLGF